MNTPLFVSQVLPQHDLEQTECDMMTVHTTGETQAYGVLIGVQEPSLRITHIGENSQKILRIPYQQLLGRDLSALLNPQDLEHLKRQLGSQNFKMINPLRYKVNDKPFDFVLHRQNGVLFLEAEPVQDESSNTAQLYAGMAQQAIMKIMSCANVQDLMQVATEQIKAISGYDRVKLYVFDENYNGQVIAEAREPYMPSFLYLHFPSWEIPSKVRDLYIKSMTRYIPHVYHVPSKILTMTGESAAGKLDMTYSVLRSCPDVHIRYLTDMGVGSSTSFSIAANGKLWAMFACHNRKPLEIGYAHRLLCEQVANAFYEVLVELENAESYQRKIKAQREEVLQELKGAADAAAAAQRKPEALLNMVNAEGAAIVSKGRIVMVGKTPSESDLRNLANIICDPYKGFVFKNDRKGLLYTSSLSKLFKVGLADTALADKVKATASGALAIPISRNRDEYIIWFRPEEVQTATWAGNPEDVFFPERYRETKFAPKKSFEAWKSSVVNTSVAWNTYEVENAATLRDALIV